MLSAWIFAAATVTGLGDRPAALLGADGPDGYLAKLEQKLNTPGLSTLISTAIPDCTSFTYSTPDYMELRNEDVGPPDVFYATTAVKPAIVEHVLVSGCGKSLRLNLAAVRLLSAPDDLKFTFQFAGESQANLVLQRDAYGYVTMAAAAARTLAGDTTPCEMSLMIYDTKVIVPVKGTAPWKEVWYTARCGYKARIAVDFIPDATGTRIGATALKDGE